jgi:nucleoid DNA-binding protein
MAKTETTTEPAGPLTKKQLCAALDQTAGAPKGTAGDVLQALAALIAAELNRTGRVALPGIGIFVASHKPALAAGPRYNPFNKETKEMPAKPAAVKVKVRPVKALADRVAPKS